METIEVTLARELGMNPALEPLAAAFGPLLISRDLRRQAAPGWRGTPPELEPEAFSSGRPLLPEGGFQRPDADLCSALKDLVPLLRASLPGLDRELAALEDAVALGSLTPEVLWAAAFGRDASVAGIAPELLSFVAAETVRPFLERQAEDLAALISGLPWQGNVCPLCGGAPHMSVLRKPEGNEAFITAHGGKRFLRCSCCATEWAHKRVSCPSCGCEEPDELVVLRDPERPFERADCCTRCKGFLLCLDSAELVAVPHPDAAALVMAPLEARAIARKFRPLAGHIWSGLMA
ncbi:FdhE protein [Humidesulfovibrio mexicanus]|uniref:FdhE protein n=1 Tax=Humidesulfovibrio mexicanus TaxID=147047 RepID=A0A238YG74_9BACT|nr:formate dehydrogenase accessory protein FdhE [Humidesulfovibrio mexicanus]SNR69741.1 FdhE protein [Humidesulfovibrio mexicanus]